MILDLHYGCQVAQSIGWKSKNGREKHSIAEAEAWTCQSL